MNSSAFQDDWDNISPEIPIDAIALDENHLARATQWSRVGMGAAQQWQIYRNSLAFLGLKQWLLERGISVPPHCSLLSSVMANLLDGVAQVSVGSMQVALCIRGFDGLHPFPMLLRYHQHFLAHLYLWVDLWEETGHVAIASGLWPQDLSAVASPHETDWLIDLPKSAPWLEPEQILFALRYPQPSNPLPRVTVPPIPIATTLTLSGLKAKLQRWTELSLVSEVLTLEESLQILRSPQLSQGFEQTLQLIFHPAWFAGINVGQWWTETVDAIQSEMGWQPLPMMAMRSPSSEKSAILGRLFQQGIEIPSHAQASYQDLSFADQSLRLYAVAWVNRSPAETTWSLLMALCNVPGADLSQGVQFEIRDRDASLAQQQLNPQETNACCYIQVTGELEEKFWVTLTDPTQPEHGMTLPPFFFNSIESNG